MTRRQVLILVVPIAAVLVGFQAAKKPVVMEDPLIAGFKKTTVASVVRRGGSGGGKARLHVAHDAARGCRAR